MRNTAVFGVTLLATVLLSGCAMMPMMPGPGPGLLVEQTKLPLDLNVDKTTLGSKTGESSAQNVLGLVAWGDCSIQAAAKNGQITTINHADCKRLYVLGLYTNFTTVVYGE